MISSSVVLTLAMALTSPTDSKMEKIVPVTESACNAIAGILRENDIICVFHQEVGKDGLVVAVPTGSNQCTIKDLKGETIMPPRDKDCNIFLQELVQKRAEPRQSIIDILIQRMKSFDILIQRMKSFLSR